MARYIDADNFRKTMIKRFGCIPCLTDYSEASRNDIPIDDALGLAPTADVVPKSEVDEIVRQWKEEANCWQNNYITELRDNEQNKADVAREIFEEIEKLIFPYMIAVMPNNTRAINLGEFAELKKKYTEEKS